MVKLLAENVVEIMQEEAQRALTDAKTGTVFKNGNKKIIFKGRKLDSSFKSAFASCDIFLEENGKKKVLYSVSSLKQSGLSFMTDTKDSIKIIKDLATKENFVRE